MQPDDLARRCVEAMYAADLASQRLGMTVEGVSAGRATVRMRVTESMLNGFRTCHGGYLVLLADSAFAFACNTYNQRTVAQGLDVTFLVAVHEGDVLVAEAVERARQGRTGIYDVTITRGGDVVAEFRGRSRTVSGSLISVVEEADGATRSESPPG